MNEFIKLNNEQDYLDFQTRTNGLHDGYIISVNHQRPVFFDNNLLCYIPESKMTLKILVSSMPGHPVVEMRFTATRDMRLHNDCLFGFSMKWGTMNHQWHPIPYVQWASEPDFDWEHHSMETDRSTTYVIATTAEWRFANDSF
ncbi:MAG: hypothetical protein IJ037_14840 [Clostridia bacterium]|nr:hypothetical protein [Clostridia bacterium]MBQ8511998.1 hypothetical protein [Clostridia bacterium]